MKFSFALFFSMLSMILKLLTSNGLMLNVKLSPSALTSPLCSSLARISSAVLISPSIVTHTFLCALPLISLTLITIESSSCAFLIALTATPELLILSREMSSYLPSRLDEVWNATIFSLNSSDSLSVSDDNAPLCEQIPNEKMFLSMSCKSWRASLVNAPAGVCKQVRRSVFSFGLSQPYLQSENMLTPKRSYSSLKSAHFCAGTS